MQPVPVQTHAQRLTHLELANDTRMARGAVRRRAAGLDRRESAEWLAEVLLKNPRSLHRAYVWQFLRYAKHAGDATAAAWMRRAGIDPWARFGRLSIEHRTSLAESLRQFGLGRARPDVRTEPRAVTAPAARKSSLTCRDCGAQLRRRSESGRCGFCIEAAEEAA